MRFAIQGLALLLLAGTATGCVFFTGMPMSADEFRHEVREGAMFVEVKEFEAKRKYAHVAKTLAKQAHKCFNVVVETTSHTGMSVSHYKNTYTPTVIKGPDKAELHLQQKTKGNVLSPKEPETGHYILVVDVEKRNAKTVDVAMYVPTMGYDHVVEAIEGWIQGADTMCPDLN